MAVMLTAPHLPSNLQTTDNIEMSQAIYRDQLCVFLGKAIESTLVFLLHTQAFPWSMPSMLQIWYQRGLEWVHRLRFEVRADTRFTFLADGT